MDPEQHRAKGVAHAIQVSCTKLADDGDLTWSAAEDAHVEVLHNPSQLLRVRLSSGKVLVCNELHKLKALRTHQLTYVISTTTQQQVGITFCIKCRDEQSAAWLDSLPLGSSHNIQQEQRQAHSHPDGAAVQQVVPHSTAAGSVFEQKTDKGSADIYFRYYGMLVNQQNMLQDYVRTGLYCAAITHNASDFAGKVVMDVGAGSGILSLFAAQAGAAKVYAVEASGMAEFARKLADGNPRLGRVIQVIHSKIEEASIPEKVDVLVSEPMGTLLVNERMLETYIYARDKFLKPGGKMFPQIGRIHCAAFSDPVLHTEVAAKAMFWTQPNFYGIDVTPLYESAMDSYFAQVVVDAIDPSALCSSCASHMFDFSTCTDTALHDFTIPLQLHITRPGPCAVHGLATWFDVLFAGTTSPLWLSTAPGLPTTHWFQLRCVLPQPILVQGPNVMLSGSFRLVAHRHQSYDLFLTLTGPPLSPGGPPQKSTGRFDLKEPYYRQLNTAVQTTAAQDSWWQQGGAAAGGGGHHAHVASTNGNTAHVNGTHIQ